MVCVFKVDMSLYMSRYYSCTQTRCVKKKKAQLPSDERGKRGAATSLLGQENRSVHEHEERDSKASTGRGFGPASMVYVARKKTNILGPGKRSIGPKWDF
jgi:hypothetical protein